MRITDQIEDLLFHQLHNFWQEIDEEVINKNIPIALNAIESNYRGMPNRRLWNGEEVVFSPYMSVQWMNFLYRLSHAIYQNG